MSEDASANSGLPANAADPFPSSTPKPFGKTAQPVAPAAIPKEKKVTLRKRSLFTPAARVSPQEQAGARLPQHMQAAASERLVSLLDDIANGVYAHCVPTGFNTLDEKLAGGLRAGLYLLGGAPGSGKTALAVNIADHIAILEQDVLFITLETSASELMLRSISRIIAQQNNGTGLTYTDLLNASAIKEKRVQNAVSYYDLSIAPHLYYYEGSGGFGTQNIRELTERHISLTGNIPVLIIDFLQVLASHDLLTTDQSSICRAAADLKCLARDYSAPVICLSGFNDCDSRHAASLASFAGTGNIGNACDAVFALQLEGQGQADFDPQHAIAAAPRKMQLVCLKYRQGPQGWCLPLRYFPAVNLFTDMVNDIPSIAQTNILKKGARAKLSPGLLPSKFASLFDK